MAHLKPSRLLEPAYATTRLERSTPLEIAQSGSLEAFLDEREPLEGPDERGRREELLLLLRGMFRDWIQEVGVANGTYADVDAARASGGSLLVSGSYRLGVCTRDSDVDTVCLAPRHVSSEDFFTSFVDKLRAAPGVTHLLPIPDASVPIIELELHGIAFDLQLVVLPTSAVTETFNFLDDGVLATIEDERAVKSLNGPRVNELIHRSVPPKSPFVTLLRALRLWGRARGLYSNKMGFWGGVNFAIVAAFVCQQNPNHTAGAALLLRFFETMVTWPWPKAIMLNTPYELSPQDDVWNPVDNPRYRRDVMPIITPAYPAMNSTFSVLECTKAIMLTEFNRGLALCRRVLSSTSEHIPTAAWAELFAPCTFFLRYEHYLVLDVITAEAAHMPAWKGFVESRIRSLMEFIQNERMPFTSICPYPAPVVRMEEVPIAAPPTVSPVTVATDAPPAAASAQAPNVPDAPPAATEAQAAAPPALPDAPSSDACAPSVPDAPPDAPIAVVVEAKDKTSGASDVEMKAAVGEPPDAPEAVSSVADARPQDSVIVEATPAPASLRRQVYTYFIGIAIHKEKAKDKKLDLSATLGYFKQTLKAWRGYREGMDVRQRMMTWKQLPEEVFPQGRAAADAQRQAMIAAAVARSSTSTSTASTGPETVRRRHEVWQRNSGDAAAAAAIRAAPAAPVYAGIPGLTAMLPPVVVPAAVPVPAVAAVTAAGTKRRIDSVTPSTAAADADVDASRKIARSVAAGAPATSAVPAGSVTPTPTPAALAPTTTRVSAAPPARRPKLAVVLKR